MRSSQQTNATGIAYEFRGAVRAGRHTALNQVIRVVAENSPRGSSVVGLEPTVLMG